jgi:predicted esterase
MTIFRLRPVKPLVTDATQVFITHGDNDSIVPFGCLRKAVQTFTDAGYGVEFMPVNGIGHQIIPAQANAAGAFFQSTLQATLRE